MYSEEDIQSAVGAGVLSAEAAAALRAHVANLRQMPRGDEENFRLITSFNDIFVTIAAVLMLVAMGGIGRALSPPLEGPSPITGALIALAAWAMAEFFTRKRRMALPSIVLLLAFVLAVFYALLGLVFLAVGTASVESDLIVAGPLLALTALAAYAHWRRFMVPITVAAGASALAGGFAALALAALSALGIEVGRAVTPLTFIVGLALFALAMRWDISDRERLTRRADVAFWLHLVAAPLIAHPLFSWLGVSGGGEVGALGAVGVLLVYAGIALVALAIDRRALLVSALAYVLAALGMLFSRFGAVELNVALTTLIIGSALLTLSAFWSPMRAAIVARLPSNLRAMLPPARSPAV